jgi:hypothetical protein
LLYDGLDPERTVQPKQALNQQYFESTLTQLKKLKQSFEKLSKGELENNLDMLKKLNSVCSLRFDSGMDEDNNKAIDQFKENNQLIEYHANLAEI